MEIATVGGLPMAVLVCTKIVNSNFFVARLRQDYQWCMQQVLGRPKMRWVRALIRTKVVMKWRRAIHDGIVCANSCAPWWRLNVPTPGGRITDYAPWQLSKETDTPNDPLPAPVCIHRLHKSF